MKKFLIALAFAGMSTVAVNAQSTIDTPTKYSVATNSFWSNWFIQVGVDMTVQNPYRSNFLKQNWHDGRTYGVDLAIGKQFTPGLALRLKANWENGLLEREHVDGAPNGMMPFIASTKDVGGYGMITGDVMFNLSNLFCGYNATRVWNFSLYPRAGVLRRFGEHTSYEPVLGVGAESSWRLGKHFGLYLDLAWNITPDKYATAVVANNNVAGVATPVAANDTRYGYEAWNWVSADFGFTFFLGRATFDPAISPADYDALAAASQAKIAQLEAEINRLRAENADLRAQLAKWANHKCPDVKGTTIVNGAAASVFFDINSSKLNSKKDLINLESIAAAVKDSDAKLVVTGCADSKNGSDAYNQQLSEARAQAVADELVSLGVNRDNIEVVGVGGVADVEPFNLNRRAIISFK